MAYVEMNRAKLAHNYNFLNKKFKEHNIEWAVVTKLLCGNTDYLREILSLHKGQICDSRISNLAAVKALDPKKKTIYIKPPAADHIKDIVTYADVSFNTEFKTIKMLSDEAVKQKKQHQVIIMIELGDLREGIMGESLMAFYEKVFELPNIEVLGIGANLNCLNGVMPSEDKLIQLSLYEQLIESKFNTSIKLVSGGTSVVIPLLDFNQVPKGVNHFRVGETLYFGKNLITGEKIEGMNDDIFTLFAQIIEITEKPVVPIGFMGANPSGEVKEVNPDDYGRTNPRAILDLGLLDVTPDFLISEDDDIQISDASSDMLVVNLNADGKYKVGDFLSFKVKYMGALSLFNSDYIDKLLV